MIEDQHNARIVIFVKNTSKLHRVPDLLMNVLEERGIKQAHIFINIAFHPYTMEYSINDVFTGKGLAVTTIKALS